MAKKPAAQEAAETNSEEDRTLPVIAEQINFEDDAGRGMESADIDSFAIPFLIVLQKGSPQVDESSGAAVDGAKAGMLFDNVSQRMWDGKDGLTVVPCAFRRVFVHWGPRSGEGAGFKGELTPEAVMSMRESGRIVEFEGRLYAPLPDGTVNPQKCDRFSDTRNHYVLVIDPETGMSSQALISMSSTQIKKSRLLNSMLAQVKKTNSAGKMYVPPTFASLVSVTTVPEKNDKGSWYGWSFQRKGDVARQDLYAEARAFHAAVAAGQVRAKYQEPDEAPARDHDDGAF